MDDAAIIRQIRGILVNDGRTWTRPFTMLNEIEALLLPDVAPADRAMAKLFAAARDAEIATVVID